MNRPTEFRLFRLYQILESSRKRITSSEAAEKLEVCSKTIERDIDFLRNLDVPIHSSKGVRGYWLVQKKCPCCGGEK